MTSPLDSQSRFAFIVGAPRCGTTTLASFLQQHPDVCFSAVKEPHFFTQRRACRPKRRRGRSGHVEQEYLERFFGQCRGDREAPRRRLGHLSLCARADGADPQALARREVRHRAARPAVDAARRSTPGCWSPATRQSAISARPGPRSTSAPRAGRSPSARSTRAGCAMTRPASSAATSSASSPRSAASAAISCCSTISPPIRRAPIASCAISSGIEPWAGTDFEPQRINKTIRIGWLQRLLKRPPKAIRTALAGEQFHKREKKVELDRKPGARRHLRGAQAAARMEQGAGQAPAARSRWCASRSSSGMRDEVILLSQGDRPRPQPLAGRRAGGQSAIRSGQRLGQQQRAVAVAVEAIAAARWHGHRPPSSRRAPSAR